MERREFLLRSACTVGAAWLHSVAFPRRAHALTLKPQPHKFSASDTVTLGKTGIQTSRLAMGTGTVGVGHHSHQTALGIDGLSRLLLNGYDHGLRFFDSADSYGSHPHVAEALKHVPRDKVTVLTKTWARDAASARADLERFRRELGTDHIDICLMHCLTEPDWTDRYKGVMDVLSEAKERGIIRAHGCSCHSDPDTVVGVIKEMRAAGKGIIGMKILGQGELRSRQDEALNFALGLNLLDAFTIGAENKTEQEDLVRRIAAA
jgi:aryl-alcohol dehydrogenase-like predicted oxidoreductase